MLRFPVCGKKHSYNQSYPGTNQPVAAHRPIDKDSDSPDNSFFYFPFQVIADAKKEEQDRKQTELLKDLQLCCQHKGFFPCDRM